MPEILRRGILARAVINSFLHVAIIIIFFRNQNALKRKMANLGMHRHQVSHVAVLSIDIYLFNPLPHTTILQQTTWKTSEQKQGTALKIRV